MAPQQNSTLIDGNLEVCPSLLNLPDEVQRYSPILAPQAQPYTDPETDEGDVRAEEDVVQAEHAPLSEGPADIDDKNNNNNNNNNNVNMQRCKNNFKTAEATASAGSPFAQRLARGQRHCGSGARSHRSRSISLYGINSTVEQGHKEIPIWIEDETRYVSGVTNRTTCADIIKALVDDEIRNGNYDYCKRARDGATASRDYSDYVITESWRGIERSYDANMAILPVWRAWSRVHNELRLTLKHQKDMRDPIKTIKCNKALSSVRKYLGKLLRFARGGKKDKKKCAAMCLVAGKNEIPDELLFVILPDKLYAGVAEEEEEEAEPLSAAATASQCFSNKNLKPTSEECAKRAEAKLLKDKLYRLSETRNSVRKRGRSSTCRRKDKRAAEIAKRRCSMNASNCIRRRKDAPLRSSIRNQLARKTNEVDELFDREYALTKELTQQCRLYKQQNDLYTDPEKQLEISIGQIQRNIEDYATQIIRTEHELLELKNEIKQDISIINNLKRMTLDSNAEENGKSAVDSVLLAANSAAIVHGADGVQSDPVTKGTGDEQMQFVDNIYEFCDNNASMLV